MHQLNELIHLQQDQLRHDKLAHADILCLPLQQRITHMALHFAKYTGALSQQPSDEKFQQVLTDALIIALASANSLNIDLAKRITELAGASSLRELARTVRMSPDNAKEIAFLGLAAATGSIAKACESLDHLEKYDFRGTLEREVTQIALLVLAATATLQIDVGPLVRARWDAVERKSIFAHDSPNRKAADGPVAGAKAGSLVT
jgi:hypothetical protein